MPGFLNVGHMAPLGAMKNFQGPQNKIRKMGGHEGPPGATELPKLCCLYKVSTPKNRHFLYPDLVSRILSANLLSYLQYRLCSQQSSIKVHKK